MNPKDLDQAAQDVRNIVEAAVSSALSPYRHRSLMFLKSEEIAKDIAILAEKCIRSLPDRLQVKPHE